MTARVEGGLPTGWPGVSRPVARGQKFMCCVRNPRNINIFVRVPGREESGSRPGSPITIQFIALALEKAEEKAQANDQTLNEYLENRTIADLVDQFTQEENCAWLTGNDFFMGNNGTFAVIREVSEASHDVIMGDTVSSDVSMADADTPIV